jgi:hypothetical protein
MSKLLKRLIISELCVEQYSGLSRIQNVANGAHRYLNTLA